VVVVPVPTSWRRRMERGIDHTGVLAAAAGREAGVRVVRGLGRRHTPAQVGLSATARAANIRGAFRVRAALGRLDGVRAVVVLDDVRTTGATMTAACRAVRGVVGKGAEIWALTVLVATDRRGAIPESGAGVGAGTARGGAGSGGVFGGEREKIAKSFELAV
jgi:predicted amidophosphoribosyltransferase